MFLHKISGQLTKPKPMHTLKNVQTSPINIGALFKIFICRTLINCCPLCLFMNKKICTSRNHHSKRYNHSFPAADRSFAELTKPKARLLAQETCLLRKEDHQWENALLAVALRSLILRRRGGTFTWQKRAKLSERLGRSSCSDQRRWQDRYATQAGTERRSTFNVKALINHMKQNNRENWHLWEMSLKMLEKLNVF